MNNATYEAPPSILAAIAGLFKRHPADGKKDRIARTSRKESVYEDGFSYPIQVARHGFGVKGLL